MLAGVLGKAGRDSDNQVGPPASLSKNREYTWEGYMHRLSGRNEDRFLGDLGDRTDSVIEERTGEIELDRKTSCSAQALKAQGRRLVLFH